MEKEEHYSERRTQEKHYSERRISIVFSFQNSVLLFPKNAVNLAATHYGCGRVRGRPLPPCLSPV